VTPNTIATRLVRDVGVAAGFLALALTFVAAMGFGGNQWSKTGENAMIPVHIRTVDEVEADYIGDVPFSDLSAFTTFVENKGVDGPITVVASQFTRFDAGTVGYEIIYEAD
jgi:hypothetical protein